MVSLLNGPHTVLVFTKERVEDEMGYELVDRWDDPSRHTAVPYEEAGAPIAYTGYYLRRR